MRRRRSRSGRSSTVSITMSKSNSIFDYLSWQPFCGLRHIKKDLRSASEKDDAGGGGGDQHASTVAAKRSTRAMATKEDHGLEADKLVVGNLVLYRRGGRFEDFNALGIAAVEGVGKTTLARSIFAKDEVNEFLPRIWIFLSEHPDDEDDSVEIAIAKRILLALGVADESIVKICKSAEIRPNTAIAATTNNQAAQPPASTKLPRKTSSIKGKFTRSSTGERNQTAAEEAERKGEEEKKAVEDSKRQILGALICAIRQELMGKRYLVVLDDASETQEWYRDLSLEPTPEKKPEEKLGFAFPKGSGGTVLVTGRAENVVKGMVGEDGIDIQRLLPLEEPKMCWDIYEATKADEKGGRKENGDAKEKDELREEVVKRCNGLPAAAVLMGEIRKMVEEDKNQQTAATVGTHPQP